jgi:FkbM family methyltransferase
VHSFEPQEYNFYRLCAHILLNNYTNITPHNVAVSYESGIDAKIPVVDYSVAHSSGSISLTDTQLATKAVRTISVDDFCIEKNLKPHLIKIDVEGHEVQVIKGALNSITTHLPKVYFECHSESDFQQIVLMLAGCSKNYQFYWHVARIFREDNFNGSKHDIYSGGGFSFNVLATVDEVSLNQPGFKKILNLDEFWPESDFPESFRSKIEILKRNLN